MSADVVVDLVTAAELCPTSDEPDKVVKEMKKWLKAEGLVDLESVSLFAEQLEKVSFVRLSGGCSVTDMPGNDCQG